MLDTDRSILLLFFSWRYKRPFPTCHRKITKSDTIWCRINWTQWCVWKDHTCKKAACYVHVLSSFVKENCRLCFHIYIFLSPGWRQALMSSSRSLLSGVMLVSHQRHTLHIFSSTSCIGLWLNLAHRVRLQALRCSIKPGLIRHEGSQFQGFGWKEIMLKDSFFAWHTKLWLTPHMKLQQTNPPLQKLPFHVCPQLNQRKTTRYNLTVTFGDPNRWSSYDIKDAWLSKRVVLVQCEPCSLGWWRPPSAGLAPWSSPCRYEWRHHHHQRLRFSPLKHAVSVEISSTQMHSVNEEQRAGGPSVLRQTFNWLPVWHNRIKGARRWTRQLFPILASASLFRACYQKLFQMLCRARLGKVVSRRNEPSEATRCVQLGEWNCLFQHVMRTRFLRDSAAILKRIALMDLELVMKLFGASMKYISNM